MSLQRLKKALSAAGTRAFSLRSLVLVATSTFRRLLPFTIRTLMGAQVPQPCPPFDTYLSTKHCRAVFFLIVFSFYSSTTALQKW
ncbi:hypothetical protein BJX68DRAFT_222396 [Aspergillus pseudodeflectus]|uniref:Secreted protein n=1 Tax=Aspergillus pseudodeflectus TaxID=176178 RepID=A0ABR4LA26_9EURO